MKRLIPAGVLIVIIICVSVFGKIIVDRNCTEVSKKLTEFKKQYLTEDTEQAEKSAEELQKQWQKCEKRISPFANRELIDNITISLSRMKNSIENNAYDNVLYEYSSVKIYLDKIIDEQSLTATSFF